eukprot:COSAG05_NODE_48_length_24425_cov_90.438543_35_plen_378_part_00
MHVRWSIRTSLSHLINAEWLAPLLIPRGTYRYSIYRTLPNGSQMLVCSIVRKILASMLSFNDQYQIACHAGCGIHCQGTWPNQFTLHQTGAGGAICAATISKKILAWTGKNKPSNHTTCRLGSPTDRFTTPKCNLHFTLHTYRDTSVEFAIDCVIAHIDSIQYSVLITFVGMCACVCGRAGRYVQRGPGAGRGRAALVPAWRSVRVGVADSEVERAAGFCRCASEHHRGELVSFARRPAVGQVGCGPLECVLDAVVDASGSGGAARVFIQLALSPAHGGIELRGDKRAHHARTTLAGLENVPHAHGSLHRPLVSPDPRVLSLVWLDAAAWGPRRPWRPRQWLTLGAVLFGNSSSTTRRSTWICLSDPDGSPPFRSSR